RRDVDDVALLDAGRKDGRQVRGLDAGVHPEGDEPRDGGRAERTQLGRTLLPGCANEHGQAGDQRHDGDPDRQRPRSPEPHVDDPVLPVGRHGVPLVRLMAQEPEWYAVTTYWKDRIVNM